MHLVLRSPGFKTCHMFYFSDKDEMSICIKNVKYLSCFLLFHSKFHMSSGKSSCLGTSVISNTEVGGPCLCILPWVIIYCSSLHIYICTVYIFIIYMCVCVYIYTMVHMYIYIDYMCYKYVTSLE